MTKLHHTFKHHSKAGAAAQAKANAKGAKRSKGGGEVEMDGTATAQSGAPLILSGARPGIDGPYQIAKTTHRFTRQGGWTVKCDVKLPGKGTGEDGRAASKS